MRLAKRVVSLILQHFQKDTDSQNEKTLLFLTALIGTTMQLMADKHGLFAFYTVEGKTNTYYIYSHTAIIK